MMLIGILIIIFVALVDQLLKIIAKKKLKEKDNDVLFGFINLTYLENAGGMLGIFAKRKIIIYITSLVAIVLSIIFIFIPMYLYEDFNFTHVFTSIFLGGAIGNFIDRLIRGHVIDYISIRFKRFRTAVFNLADLCIFIGIIGILVGVIIYGI